MNAFCFILSTDVQDVIYLIRANAICTVECQTLKSLVISGGFSFLWMFILTDGIRKITLKEVITLFYNSVNGKLL